MLAGTYYKNDVLDFKSGNKFILKGCVIWLENSICGEGVVEIGIVNKQGETRSFAVYEKDIDKAIELGILEKINKDVIVEELKTEPSFNIGDVVYCDFSDGGIIVERHYDLYLGWLYKTVDVNSDGLEFLESDCDIQEKYLSKIESNRIEYTTKLDKDNKYKITIIKVEE